MTISPLHFALDHGIGSLCSFPDLLTIMGLVLKLERPWLSTMTLTCSPLSKARRVVNDEADISGRSA